MAGISDFTDLITFKVPDKTGNTSGGNTEGYTTLVTTRASANKIDGYRNVENGYDSIIEVYEFMCYWRYNLEQNIDRDTRIVYDEKEFRLESWDTIDNGVKLMKFKASCIS